MKLDPYTSYYTQKINSKWIRDLNVKARTKQFHGFSLGSGFLDMSSKALATKGKKIDNL